MKSLMDGLWKETTISFPICVVLMKLPSSSLSASSQSLGFVGNPKRVCRDS